MKNKFFVTLLILSMLLSMGTAAQAADLILNSTELEYQAQFRTQLQDQFDIDAEARTQMMERYRAMEQDQICFNDIDGHWAREQIRLAHFWGLANGFPDGSFSPNGPTTGTQSVLMIRNMIACLEAFDIEGEAEEAAIDWGRVPAWAVKAFQEETTNQIALMSRNYGNESISRLNFSLMLAKSLNIGNLPYDEETVFYLDQDQISPDDLGYILALRELGIVSGWNGRFYPDNKITRAEVVVILNRVVHVIDAGSANDDANDCGG